MNCLAIDTTNGTLAVVLISGERVYRRHEEVGKSGHSRLLMPYIDEVLKEADMRAEDLDAVAAVVGPGSFTGIRIGVSAMTAIAFATGAKRIAVTSFELIAYSRTTVTAAVDAGHGNVYAAECRDGKVTSARFIEAAENKNGIADAQYKPACEPWIALEQVVRRKIAEADYCEALEPFYMRKSQAEREKDGI